MKAVTDHCSLPPRRATELIAASLIFLASADTKHKQKVWAQICSDKEFKIDRFLSYTLESTCKNKDADGTARVLNKVGALKIL